MSRLKLDRAKGNPGRYLMLTFLGRISPFSGRFEGILLRSSWASLGRDVYSMTRSAPFVAVLTSENVAQSIGLHGEGEDNS